jgi:hypothetical protein
VSAAGRKAWSIRYKPKGGERKRETHGTYPAVSLVAARDRARDIAGAATKGIDLPPAPAEAGECQLDLYADRTSAKTMRANQLRLWFASMAYLLVCALRRIGLAHTQFAKPPAARSGSSY